MHSGDTPSPHRPAAAHGIPPDAIVETITLAVPAEQLFATWCRVADWPLWDPDTREAWLDGPLRPGARGRLRPRKGRAVAMRVDAVEPGRRLLLHCPVLGSSLHFDHRAEPLPGGGCRATHAVWFRGWLAPLLRASVGRDVARGLPHTLASLKRFAERAQPAQAASA